MVRKASRVGSATVVSALALVALVSTGVVEAQVHACPLDRTRVDGSLIAERTSIADVEAPLLSSAQFAPNGMIVGTHRTTREVVVLDADLNVVRTVGPKGWGSGAYMEPMAAVMDERGRVFVADGAGSVIMYGEDGAFLRRDPLPPSFTPSAMATDGEVVYLTDRGMPRIDSLRRRPVLVAYDPSTGESEVLLHQTPEWFGRPPVYRHRSPTLIPRVDAYGNVYVGFGQGYEIWRITGPEEYEVVVRGCVPEPALRLLQIPDETPGTRVGGPLGFGSYQVLADFAVLSDGRVVTRVGLYADGMSRRSLELYSAAGELLRAWSLGPGRLVSGWAAMDVRDPTRHLFRDAAGRVWLVQFPTIEGID